MKSRFVSAALVGAVATFAVAPTLAADNDAVAKFYENRTITVVIGAGMGGSYGLYGQLTAQFLGDHIPGKPKVIVQSIPGAGGTKALAYVYNAAPKDGTVIMGGHQEVLQETVLNPKAKFDVRKFRWLGRYVDVDYVGFVAGRTGVKTLDDAKKRQVIYGATGRRAANALGPLAFNKFAGTKFKVVPGYKSTAEMFIAIDRKELDAITATWVVMKAMHMPKIQSGQLVPVFAMSLDRLKEYPNVPAITEFGSNPAEKKFLKFWATGGSIGRSVFVPPGVPEDRLKALRAAFDAMIKTPRFLAEAEKRKASLNPLSGAEVEAKIASVMDISDADVASYRKIFGELLKAVPNKK